MRRLRDVVVNPWVFAVWALLVTLVLTSAYFADPYIFGFTTLILAAISVGVGLIGLSAALLSKTLSWRTRALIVVSVVATAVALVGAFAVLGTFKWA